MCMLLMCVILRLMTKKEFDNLIEGFFQLLLGKRLPRLTVALKSYQDLILQILCAVILQIIGYSYKLESDFFAFGLLLKSPQKPNSVEKVSNMAYVLCPLVSV